MNRANHSTEAALVKVVINLRSKMDMKNTFCISTTGLKRSL